MIIYWRVGNDCNLNCSYCKIVGVKKLADIKEHVPDVGYVDKVALFVRRSVKNNGNQTPILVFYGGEPLLYHESLTKFIHETRDLKMEYVLHTNGTLLERTNAELLDNVSTIVVSVDGDEITTDKYRGHGTYSRVRQGVEYIRSVFKGEVIARTTLTLDASIKNAVLNLLEWTDGVFWQIENSPAFDKELSRSFLSRYEADLNCLVRLWMDHLRKGVVKKLLPFQAVVSALLGKGNEGSPRCGCGSRLIVIDGESCFACDELEGLTDDVYLGTIHGNVNPKRDVISTRIDETCKHCSIKPVCRGRCYNSLAFFPTEKFQFYCKATNLLVTQISPQIPEIAQLIEDGVVRFDDLMHPALNVVDQIP